jgi:putative SOS response-associated peptidase YedK
VNYLAVQDARRYEPAFGVQMPLGPWVSELYPKSRGTFIRRRGDAIGLEREASGGTWGLLPWFAKTPEIKFNTMNARSETVATAALYKAPWRAASVASSQWMPSSCRLGDGQAHRKRR